MFDIHTEITRFSIYLTEIVGKCVLYLNKGMNNNPT